MIAKRTRLLITLATAPLALAACKQEAQAPAGESPKGEALQPWRRLRARPGPKWSK